MTRPLALLSRRAPPRLPPENPEMVAARRQAILYGSVDSAPRRKHLPRAVLLGVVLGPAGLAYSTVGGAVAMGVLNAAGVWIAGIGTLAFLWPLSGVLGYLAARAHNLELDIREAGFAIDGERIANGSLEFQETIGLQPHFSLVPGSNRPTVTGFSSMKHFLKETDFTPHEVAEVFALTRDLKQKRGREASTVLQHQTWAMIFSKSSTRTRVSFEVGVHELGGNPLFLNKGDIQLGRGESIEDTAKVLSRFVHGLIVRTYDHAEVERLAKAGTIPVINALTDFLHPCQIYADAFTLAERWGKGGDLLGSLKGKKIAFLGDTACNMANSWILGANLFGMKISLSGPKGFEPDAHFNLFLAKEGFSHGYHFTTDPFEAVKDADVVYTDVWVSMGKEAESAERIKQMSPYSVTAKLFAAAKPDAWFMHCLPAYPGKEVTQEVLDNPRSIIFDQAENRLHVQKAIVAVLAKQARG